jgi:folate-dependent phosphoribosylglycinamide formyltransferase PurN
MNLHPSTRRILAADTESAGSRCSIHLVTRAVNAGKIIRNLVTKTGCTKQTVLQYSLATGGDHRPV